MKILYSIRNLCIASILLLQGSTLLAQNNILSSIKSEVDRNKSQLKIEGLKSPFFISYMIIDDVYMEMKASRGSLIYSAVYPNRRGIPKVLVGDYQHNNSNYRDFNSQYGGGYPTSICLDDNAKGIATSIWSDLDKKYKSAAEIYEKKMSIIKQQKQTVDEEKLFDFEKANPVNLILSPKKVNMDKAYWENIVKKASESFTKYTDLISCNVTAEVNNKMVYYYDTDNSQYIVPVSLYKLYLSVSAITDDGEELSDQTYFEHSDFEQMPDLKSLTDSCDHFIQEFLKLRNAPLINESYCGPVLFEKMALAEAMQQFFFSDVLIAGRKPVVDSEFSRYGNRNFNGNTMEMMMDKKIISRSLSIKSLTGTEYYKGTKLDGYYPIDAEGVIPDKELVLVENGVLKNMLNGRTQTSKILRSNGHVRTSNQMTNSIIPGNVQLTCTQTFSSEELKTKLINAAKEEDLEYGYVVRRQRNNSRNFLVYKVYVADGHEELVRGVALPDFNLKSFKRVLGASNQEFIYNSFGLGAMTTYIIPEGLLFEELDVTKNNSITFKMPYLVPMPK